MTTLTSPYSHIAVRGSLAPADRPGAEADHANAAANSSEDSRPHYGFTHCPLALDDLTAASMKARPLTPSSIVGNWAPSGGFPPPSPLGRRETCSSTNALNYIELKGLTARPCPKK